MGDRGFFRVWALVFVGCGSRTCLRFVRTVYAGYDGRGCVRDRHRQLPILYQSLRILDKHIVSGYLFTNTKSPVRCVHGDPRFILRFRTQCNIARSAFPPSDQRTGARVFPKGEGGGLIALTLKLRVNTPLNIEVVIRVLRLLAPRVLPLIPPVILTFTRLFELCEMGIHGDCQWGRALRDGLPFPGGDLECRLNPIVGKFVLHLIRFKVVLELTGEGTVSELAVIGDDDLVCLLVNAVMKDGISARFGRLNQAGIKGSDGLVLPVIKNMPRNTDLNTALRVTPLAARGKVDLAGSCGIAAIWRHVQLIRRFIDLRGFGSLNPLQGMGYDDPAVGLVVLVIGLLHGLLHGLLVGLLHRLLHGLLVGLLHCVSRGEPARYRQDHDHGKKQREYSFPYRLLHLFTLPFLIIWMIYLHACLAPPACPMAAGNRFQAATPSSLP